MIEFTARDGWARCGLPPVLIPAGAIRRVRKNLRGLADPLLVAAGRRVTFLWFDIHRQRAALLFDSIRAQGECGLGAALACRRECDDFPGGGASQPCAKQAECRRVAPWPWPAGALRCS
jgi:hypothetical protein